MENAILRLKSGDSHPCSFSDARSLDALLAKIADPSQPGPPTMTLRSDKGEAVDVALSDVAGVEMSPPFCMARDFLSPEEIDNVTAFAMINADKFRDSTVSQIDNQDNSNPDYRLRRSHLLDDVGAIMPMFLAKLEALMPQIWPHLRTPPQSYQRVECQMAYHGDGDFFATHTDNGLPDIAHRRVSYVYYFHQEPRRFAGGHLRLYNTLMENGVQSCGAKLIDIEPPRNSLIVFPSNCYHEVTPLQARPGGLLDQRLTLNGWLCA